jgi:hypothetical protein
MVNLEPVEHRFYVAHYETAYQQFDKYYVFLERCIRDLLAPGGSLGMVVSRRFFHIESGKKLRQFLSRQAYVARLVDFGSSQLFEGRTTYTCLLFVHKSGPATAPGVDTLPYELITTPRDWIAGQVAPRAPIALPRRLVSGDASWLLPATVQELALVEALLADDLRLGDIADVFNGIQTSRNDVYVIAEWRDVDPGTIAFDRDGRTWPIERAILRPFFDSRRGVLRSFYPLPPNALVVFPYRVGVAEGRHSATAIPPATMQATFPLAYAWLEHNRAVLEARNISPTPYPPGEWYRYGRDQALASFDGRPKIVVGVQSLGDKYAYDDTDTLLASGGTAGECAIAAFQEGRGRSPYDLRFLLALLNHKAIEFFCRKRGSPFRGGYYARGTAVLKQVPLPRVDPTADDSRAQLYASIVAQCQVLLDICRQLTTVTSGAARAGLERRRDYTKGQMDAQISSLLGVTDIIGDIELPR